MLRRRTLVTASFYEDLVRIFRTVGHCYAEVARQAQCDERTARRAYDEGWPQLGFGPIRDRLASEAVDAQRVAREAAARAAEVAAAAKERERAERAEAAEQERQMLRVARGDVLSALVIAAELMPAMRVLTQVISEACKTGASGELPKIVPSQAMALVVRHALIVQRAVGACEAIVQLSRLERGETTANVGLQANDISLEDALAELEAVGNLAASTRRALPD